MNIDEFLTLYREAIQRLGATFVTTRPIRLKLQHRHREAEPTYEYYCPITITTEYVTGQFFDYSEEVEAAIAALKLDPTVASAIIDAADYASDPKLYNQLLPKKGGDS